MYPILPISLSEGEPLILPFRVTDDLPKWHELGRVKSVSIQVKVSSIEPSLDKMEVSLNDFTLPDSIRQEIDTHFRTLKNIATSPYGYIMDYHLPPEHYPKKGKNHVAITLTKKDPRIKGTIDVIDVDCSIEYRLHRHFEESPIEY